MADEKAVLREIHTLEEEIQSLQDQLEHPESLDTGSIIHQAGTETLKDRPGFQVYSSLQKQLEITRAITGVNISHIQRISPGNSIDICGSIGDVDFTVKYRVQQSQQDGAKEPFLEDLKVTIKQRQPEQITSFITKCEETCNLLTFFQGFTAYVKWCEHRHKAFTHYKNKHPQVVEVKTTEQGQVMQVKATGAVYCICWCHMITDHLTIVPLIQLFIDTKATGPAQESLPEKFQLLLTNHGIETAIDTLLECVL